MNYVVARREYYLFHYANSQTANPNICPMSSLLGRNMRQSSHHRLAHTPPLSSSPLSELDRRHGKPAVENEPITLLKTFGVMVGVVSTESEMDSGGGWGLVGPSCIGYDNVCCCLVGHGFGASRLSPQFILLLTKIQFLAKQ
jgi:hypothetical protein